jgi:hypothetical protein
MGNKTEHFFRGCHCIAKSEILNCRLSELEMLNLQISRWENDFKIGIGWYFREETEDFVRYHLAEHGHSDWVNWHIKVLESQVE